MEAIQAGWLSILPPVIAIVLAFLTKEVISSLTLGILSGAVIYAALSYDGVVMVAAKTVETAFSTMGATGGSVSKFNILLFLSLLGALVVVVTKAGGSKAYGNWAANKLRSATAAQLATSALGALIFIDDYFNCLTVGNGQVRYFPGKAGIHHRRYRSTNLYYRTSFVLGCCNWFKSFGNRRVRERLGSFCCDHSV